MLNYNGYYKAPITEKDKIEAVVEEPEVVDTVDVDDEDLVVETPDPIDGVVSGVNKLNVRKEPSTDAEVVCVIPVNTEVLIDLEESTEDFYKVCTSAGIEGFCMKAYISVE